jgi:hypothetical protein
MDKDVGRLVLLYVDENLSDSMTVGEIRKLAFKILPEASIRSIVKKMVRNKNARIIEKITIKI